MTTRKLRVCAECHRHVRPLETCPFCGAAPSHVVAVGAAVVVAAGLVLAGCGREQKASVYGGPPQEYIERRPTLAADGGASDTTDAAPGDAAPIVPR